MKPSYTPDVNPIIHLINHLGEGLVGIEVGCHRGESLIAFVNYCDNVKEMHGVDNWLPYTDYLGDPYGPQYSVDDFDQEFNKNLCYLNVKYHSDDPDKITIHHMDSNECAKTFDDGYFDFVFVDTYMTDDQVTNDLEVWYPKVKSGGFFIGHDWSVSILQDRVKSFRKKNNITSRMSTYDNCFVWRK